MTKSEELDDIIVSEIRKESKEDEERFHRLYEDVYDFLIIVVNKYLQEAIDDELRNKGILEVGMMLEDRDENGWLVLMVNQSRCRVQSLSSGEQKDISPATPWKILFKPEKERVENDDRRSEVTED